MPNNNTAGEQPSTDTSTQASQEPVIVNVPPLPPQSREVKQDVGPDERNMFEKETKSKK